jgi:prepilin-type processing-associated H-X9-DG protein
MINKEAGIQRPSQTFVFIDDQNSQIHGTFLLFPEPSTDWVAPPGDRHAQGANLSFADGHAEPWKWQSPKPIDEVICQLTPTANPLDLEDLRRLQNAIP